MSSDDDKVATIAPSWTWWLHPEEERDALSEDKYPYRLLAMGQHKDAMLVYGGDDGLLVRAHDQKTVRRWEDDALRAIAVSPNQRTVIVGVDSGEVEIYSFEDYDNSKDDGGIHPFCAIDTDAAGGGDNDDDDDVFLSQSDKLTSPQTSDKMRPGPRGEAPVRDIVFLNDDIVAIAFESDLKLVNLAKEDMSTTYYLSKESKSQHGGTGVRGMAWNAKYEILATLGLDGSVCFWKCPLSDPASSTLWKKESNLKIAKKDVGEILGADAWDRSSRPWNTDDHLAIPGANLWQLIQWTSDPELDYTQLFQTDTVHNKTMVLVRSRGMQWISTDRAGEVVLWNLESKTMKEQCRLSTSPGSAPTDALWTDDTFWLVTADGRILGWEQSVLPKPVDSIMASQTEEVMKNDQSTNSKESGEVEPSAGAPIRKRLQKAGDAQGSDDDDDDIDFSQPAKPFVEDQAMEDNDDDEDDENRASTQESTHNLGETQKNATKEDNDDDDDDDDDEHSFDMDQFPPATSRPSPAVSFPVVEPQAAFAPSSTPLEDPRRFLCWNQQGAMSVRETDPGRSTIDIDFTDSAFRRPISFTDTVGFILGSLGEDGAILASDVPDFDDDDDNDLGDVVDGLNISETTKAALKNSRRKSVSTNGSTIYFRRYETFASNRDKDWYLTLPAGERVLGCATGEGWAAVVTHRRFVRLFSNGGNQGQVFWIEGDPVSMVGRSRFLAVVYHQSSPLGNGTQKLGYSVFDAVAGRVVAKGALSCLSSRASLQWIGFSNDSALMAMDSDGMLSMLVASAESTQYWEWMPVLDTLALRKSSEDTHWPIHVSDGKLVCVPLKGGKKYPDVARRPVTTTIGLRLPLARGPLPSIHAVEELSVRALVTLHQRKAVQQAISPGEEVEDEDFATEYHALSAQVDKVTLKFFASLIEAGKLERALDLVERLHLERSFDLAMKIAGRHSKLVDRIEEVRDRKFPVADEDEVDEYESSPEVTAEYAVHSRVSPESVVNRNKKRSMNDWSESSAKAHRVS